MSKLKGFRTIAVGLAVIVTGYLTSLGIVLPENEQAALQTAIVGLLMIGLRYITTGKVGE